ncbi:hypothetical protein BLA33_04575 (plasmid) [Borreliella garinii]|nr:hypothetical protein BLA33_04575 [Borreliella garinii]AZA28283.1 hypothetical protein DB281_04325 [Borreliella garinii]
MKITKTFILLRPSITNSNKKIVAINIFFQEEKLILLFFFTYLIRVQTKNNNIFNIYLIFIKV